MNSTMNSRLVSTSLSTVFVSNDSHNRLLFCTSEDAVNWPGNTHVGEELSSAGPAVASFKNKLWVAFIANDSSNRILICSSSDGTNWTPSIQVGQSSRTTPSLCVHEGKLWLAFIANDSSDRILICSSPDGMSWSSNSMTGQSSSYAPSLCSFNGRLWLAFMANDSSMKLLICSSPDGSNWSGNTQTGEYSKDGPSLCAFNGKLWLGFLADNKDNTLLIISSSDGVSWSRNTSCNQFSKAAPSLTSIQDKMYLGFIANDASNNVLVCTSSNGTSWSGSTQIGQMSHTRPAFFAQQLMKGTLRPKYQVLSVVYAPPGTRDGKSASQVIYSASSSAGTTNSISNSVAKGLSVTATAGGGDLSASGGVSASQNKTDTSTLDVLKTSGCSLTVQGPDQDGIDHAYDQFWLLLNPLYTVTSDNWGQVTWTMSVDGNRMQQTYVYAGWLKDPRTMPPGVKADLDQAGLTQDDYNQILSLNPFATGSTGIDTKRYMPIGQSLPYIPPYTRGDVADVETFTEENSITVSETHSVEVQYGVSVTLTEGFGSIFSVDETGSMQWMNTNSKGTSSSKTQSASLSMAGPSHGYTGPTRVDVYWDTVYNTFMFAFPTGV